MEKYILYYSKERYKSYITSKDIELVVKKLSTKKVSEPDSFTCEFYHL